MPSADRRIQRCITTGNMHNGPAPLPATYVACACVCVCLLMPAVKILRGHEMVDFQGVLDVAFHPTQPWVFTAGADTNICLFVNP